MELAATVKNAAWGNLSLELQSAHELSHLDSSFIKMPKTLKIDTTAEQSHLVNVHDMHMGYNNGNANLNFCVSMEVNEKDYEDAMYEAGLKLNDLNIVMEYFMLEDIIGKNYLCHVVGIEMDWEDIEED